MKNALKLALNANRALAGDPPTGFSLSDSSHPENAALGEVVGTLSATDPDGGTVIFSIPDATVPFAISGNSLIVAGVLDFETRASWPFNIQALASRGGSTLNAVTITVTDVSETPGGEQPPIPDPGDVEEDGNFTTPTTVTQVDAAIKIHGKKAPGSIGKFIVPLPDLEADSIVTIHWTLDASLMSLQGRKILAGFVLKEGNDFHMVGPQGDGTANGVNIKTIYGDGKWNSQTGLTEVNDGAPANGSQYDMWFQIEVDSSGDKYTIRTATDPSEQADFDDEFTGRDSPPFALVVDAADFGFGALFQADDTGVYSFTLEFYEEGEPEFGGPLWTPAELSPRVWWDYSDPLNITVSGSDITACDDLSGNGFNGVIGSNANERPDSITVADWGNLLGAQAVSGDGGNDQVSTGIGSSAGVAQPMTFASIFKTGASIADIEQLYGTSGTDQVSLRWSGVSDFPHAFAGSAVQRHHVTISANTSYIDITTLNGTMSHSRINGNKGAAFSPGAGTAAGDAIGWGLFNGSWTPPKYTMGQFIYVGRDLTHDEELKLEGYWAHRFQRTGQLDSDHPYKNDPPEITPDLTVFESTSQGNDAGWGGYTVVNQIVAGNLAAPVDGAGPWVRITFEFHSLSSGAQMNGMYFGKTDGGIGFDGTQVQIMFGGSGTITGDGVKKEYISDWAQMGSDFDESVGYNLAMQFPVGGTIDLSTSTAGATGNQVFYKFAADAATQSKSGYTFHNLNTVKGVMRIEISASDPT